MQGNPLGCRLFRQDLVGPLCNSMQLFQEAGGMEWAAKQGGGRLSGRGRNALDEANLYLYKNVEIAGLVASARSRSLHFVVCPCCFTSDDGLQSLPVSARPRFYATSGSDTEQYVCSCSFNSTSWR